jgi:hypothetical protein
VQTDSGYNNDYWVIFATDSKGCSPLEVERAGALTFIEIAPNFTPPPPFQAYSNIHSVCNNAIVEPEMAEYELNLPNFGAWSSFRASGKVRIGS